MPLPRSCWDLAGIENSGLDSEVMLCCRGLGMAPVPFRLKTAVDWVPRFLNFELQLSVARMNRNQPQKRTHELIHIYIYNAYIYTHTYDICTYV